jgi:Tfp pilus assembly protein PilF
VPGRREPERRRRPRPRRDRSADAHEIAHGAALDPDHPDMAIRHSNLGLVLRDLGDLPGARAEFKRALQIGHATVGPNHPNMATFRRNLDQVLQQLGGQ